MGVAPVTMSTDLLKTGGYGRLKPMLKALTSAVQESGAVTLREWKDGRYRASEAAGYRDWIQEHVVDIAGEGRGPYTMEANAKLPRSVDAKLQMWGCTACNLCVTVCPNGAFMKLPSPSQLADEIGGRWQYLVIVDLCNECGNCMTFCPEEGDPAQIKPKLYLDDARFAEAEGQAFHLIDNAGVVSVLAADGWDSELETLSAVIAGDQGVPIRAMDI